MFYRQCPIKRSKKKEVFLPQWDLGPPSKVVRGVGRRRLRRYRAFVPSLASLVPPAHVAAGGTPPPAPSRLPTTADKAMDFKPIPASRLANDRA